jgi:hypothetical protein
MEESLPDQPSVVRNPGRADKWPKWHQSALEVSSMRHSCLSFGFCSSGKRLHGSAELIGQPGRHSTKGPSLWTSLAFRCLRPFCGLEADSAGLKLCFCLKSHGTCQVLMNGSMSDCCPIHRAKCPIGMQGKSFGRRSSWLPVQSVEGQRDSPRDRAPARPARRPRRRDSRLPTRDREPILGTPPSALPSCRGFPDRQAAASAIRG